MSAKSIGEIFDYTREHSQAPELTDRVLAHYFAAGELAGKTVLDAGCRVGDHSAALARQGARRVVGVDLSAQCLAEARRRYAGTPELEFLQGDIADLGRFADSSFDVVYCTGTMTFLTPEQARRALREFVRITRPGGVILVLFLRDRGPLPRLATWIADRLPLRLYRALVEAAGGLLRPLAPWVLGRPVGESFFKNDILWCLQGSHYGVPAAIPDDFLVETIRAEFCSPETTVSYRLPVPADKGALEFGPVPAARSRGVARRALPTGAVLFLGLLAAAGQAQNWPAFRGPDAGGVAAGPGPTTWDVQQSVHVKWKTEIPGLGHSSPVVWGDRVFVTTAVTSAPHPDFPKGLSGDLSSSPDMSSHSWRVYCLDKKTGKVIWEKVLHEGAPRSKRHTRNSFATPTPATDGKHLVVFFGSEGLFGLDLDGKLLWRQDLGALDVGFYADHQFQWGIGSSPVLYGNLVLVQADLDRDSFLAAYDVETGKPVWKTPRADRQSWSTPGLTRGLAQDEVVTLAPRAVRGYDPKTGRELWHLDWNMDIIESTPVFANGVLYVSSGKGAQQPIFALRPGARGDITPQPGKPLDPHLVWYKDRGGPITTSPLVYGDYLYALTDQGILRCLALATGEEVYKQRLTSEFLSSPVMADGKLYLTALDGDIYVVRAGPRYEQLAVNAMDEVSYPTPAISEGLLIVRTQHHLYGIEETASPAGGRSR